MTRLGSTSVYSDRCRLCLCLQVELTIRTLPALPPGAKYQCIFGDTAPTDAQVTASGLSCQTPPPALRPPVPAGADHVAVPLSVRSSETNKDFVSREFSYYDCGRHATCADCASSAWACNWCVYDNVCTHNATSCRRTVVSGENVSVMRLLAEVRCVFFYPLVMLLNLLTSLQH